MSRPNPPLDLHDGLSVVRRCPLVEHAHPGDAWDAALREFSRHPCATSWRELWQTVPHDRVYPRLQASVRRLADLGVEPDVLFELAACLGASPAVFELAETGAASPDVILAHAQTERLRGLWTALAAHAAAARGDAQRAVELARQARDEATIDVGLVDVQVCRLAATLDDLHRSQLHDEQENAMLDTTIVSPEEPTFHDGLFHLGDPTIRRDVVATDHPCEYSLMSYLAAATAGQRVGVGQLFVHVPVGGNAFDVHEINLVIIPDVGVWVCAPVFRSAAESLSWARTALAVLEDELGELPVHIALIPLLDDIRPNLRGVDPTHVYDTTIFADVAGTLSRRAGSSSRGADVNRVIAELLSVGEWLDAKDGSYDDWEIPTWLDAMIPR